MAAASRSKASSGATWRAVFGQRGGAIAGVVRRVSQVDPDADRHRRVAFVLATVSIRMPESLA
jgi:hypothetical protein